MNPLLLEILRLTSDEDSTVGFLRTEGMSCFTLEDEFRTKKVWAETRIPQGAYKVKLREEGGMLKRYQERFGKQGHPGMLHLQDVPNFEHVYIHVGNTDDDTAGCVLVGMGAQCVNRGGYLLHSTEAYIALYQRCLAALKQGREVIVDIKDFDREFE